MCRSVHVVCSGRVFRPGDVDERLKSYDQKA